MVCYCPLSVLSVPESILNEGQLHLAAIFQLSPRYHGDPLFLLLWDFFMNLVVSRGVSVCWGREQVPRSCGSEGQERSSGRTQGRGGHVPRTHASTKDSHFKHPVKMQRGRWPSLCSVVQLSHILAVALHPFALFLSLHPVSHKSDSNPPLLSSTSAVVSLRLLEAMMN